MLLIIFLKSNAVRYLITCQRKLLHITLALLRKSNMLVLLMFYTQHWLKLKKMRLCPKIYTNTKFYGKFI